MTIDAALLAKLVCPATRAALRYDADGSELISDAAGLAYPVRDGMPVMLIGEARALAGATETASPLSRE